MQTLLPGLLIVLTTAAAPDGAPESLEPVTAKADIVITGSFVAVPQRLKTRSGRPDVERYRADVRIHDVRKGDVDERLRRGATIPVRITRRPGDTAAALPELKLKQDYVLFLKFNPENRKRPYTTTDPQLGVLPLTPPVLRLLRHKPDPPAGDDPSKDHLSFDPLKLAVNEAVKLEVDPKNYRLDKGEVATYSPQKGPVHWLVSFPARGGSQPLLIGGTGRSFIRRIDTRNQRVASETVVPSRRNPAGDWRVFLPAGYEHEMTLTDAGHDFYVLAPTGVTFGGIYVLDGDRLISIEEHGRKQERFVWELRTPYLMTLVESTDTYGGNYDHAILFRPRHKETE